MCIAIAIVHLPPRINPAMCCQGSRSHPAPPAQTYPPGRIHPRDLSACSGAGRQAGARLGVHAAEHPPPLASLCSSAPTSYPSASHPEFQFRSQVSENSYSPSAERVCTSPGLPGLGETTGARSKNPGESGGEPRPAALGPCLGSQQRPQWKKKTPLTLSSTDRPDI